MCVFSEKNSHGKWEHYCSMNYFTFCHTVKEVSSVAFKRTADKPKLVWSFRSNVNVLLGTTVLGSRIWWNQLMSGHNWFLFEYLWKWTFPGPFAIVNTTLVSQSRPLWIWTWASSLFHLFLPLAFFHIKHLYLLLFSSITSKTFLRCSLICLLPRKSILRMLLYTSPNHLNLAFKLPTPFDIKILPK